MRRTRGLRTLRFDGMQLKEGTQCVSHDSACRFHFVCVCCRLVRVSCHLLRSCPSCLAACCPRQMCIFYLRLTSIPVGIVSREYCEEIALNKCQEESKAKTSARLFFEGVRASDCPRATVSGSLAYRTNAATSQHATWTSCRSRHCLHPEPWPHVPPTREWMPLPHNSRAH